MLKCFRMDLNRKEQCRLGLIQGLHRLRSFQRSPRLDHCGSACDRDAVDGGRRNPGQQGPAQPARCAKSKANAKIDPMGPYDFNQYQGRLYRIFEETVLEGVATNHIDGGFSPGNTDIPIPRKVPTLAAQPLQTIDSLDHTLRSIAEYSEISRLRYAVNFFTSCCPLMS
jgi:hypothetical protein